MIKYGLKIEAEKKNKKNHSTFMSVFLFILLPFRTIKIEIKCNLLFQSRSNNIMNYQTQYWQVSSSNVGQFFETRTKPWQLLGQFLRFIIIFFTKSNNWPQNP
jgi:hypothetical protein